MQTLAVCKADYRVMLDYVYQADENLTKGDFVKAEGDLNWVREKIDECGRRVDREDKLDRLRDMHGRVSLYVEIGEAIFENWTW